MDVVVIHPFTPLDAPLMAFQLFNKMIDRNPKVTVRKCSQMTITRDSEGPAHYDGEPVTLGKEIHVRMIKGGLKVLIPVLVLPDDLPHIRMGLIRPVRKAELPVPIGLVQDGVDHLPKVLLRGVVEGHQD